MANAIQIKETLQIFTGVSGGEFTDSGKPVLVEPGERIIKSDALEDGHFIREQNIADGAIAVAPQTLANGIFYLYLRVSDPVQLDFEQNSVARVLHVGDELLIDLDPTINTYHMKILTITAIVDGTEIRCYWAGV